MLKLKFNTNSEQNTNFNFNMAHHMSRGDYYHEGVNSRRSMRGGSTREERGIAAEMREMHPKIQSTDNSDFTQRDNQFHSLINQVVHDKTNNPFPIPGAMNLIRSVFEKKRYKAFGRADAPDQSVKDAVDDNIRILTGFMPAMTGTAFQAARGFTDTPQAQFMTVPNAPSRGLRPVPARQSYDQLLADAENNHIDIPSVYTHPNPTDRIVNRLRAYIEDEKEKRLANENEGVDGEPPLIGPEGVPMDPN